MSPAAPAAPAGLGPERPPPWRHPAFLGPLVGAALLGLGFVAAGVAWF